jgi:hypothetical protein
MNNLPARLRLAALAMGAATLLTLGAGCSSTSQPPGQNNLSGIAKYYGQYQSKNKGQTPPDEKKFKEFIQKTDSGAKLDEMFTSPRDSQPYVVLYGLKASMPDPKKGAPIIAYEKQGVGGKHMVARSTTEVEEVDLAQLKEWVPNP